MAVRRVRETSFSAAVSVTLTHAIAGTSGARFNASATNDDTGSVTRGSRSVVCFSSIWTVGRSGKAVGDGCNSGDWPGGQDHNSEISLTNRVIEITVSITVLYSAGWMHFGATAFRKLRAVV
jgi:hypothetical protein